MNYFTLAFGVRVCCYKGIGQMFSVVAVFFLWTGFGVIWVDISYTVLINLAFKKKIQRKIKDIQRLGNKYSLKA